MYSQGNITERKIHPYGLYTYYGSNYFIGKCEERDALRQFKLIRIKDIELLKEKFEKDDFDLSDYLKNTLGIFKDKSYKVNIDYSKEDWDNNISEETKEILALIYRDYIVSPEERKELIKEEAEFEKQKELELREKYNPDNLFKNKHKEINKEIEKENETAIVQYHESILTKIKKWFMRIFNKQ